MSVRTIPVIGVNILTVRNPARRDFINAILPRKALFYQNTHCKRVLANWLHERYARRIRKWDATFNSNVSYVYRQNR